MAEIRQAESKPIWKAWWFWLVIAVAIVFGIVPIAWVVYSSIMFQEAMQAVEQQGMTEEEYADWVIDFSGRMTPLFKAISSTSVSASKGIISLDEAKKRFKSYSNVLAGYVEEAKDIDPPAKYEESHKHLVKGLELWVEALDIAYQAIDTNDNDLMLLAVQKIDEANKELELAADLMEAAS